MDDSPNEQACGAINQRESYSSSNVEEIIFDHNVAVSQPSTSARPIQSQKTVAVQNRNSRPAIQWCKTNERHNLESGSTEWLGRADFGESLDTPAQ